jgi:molybdate transport repressor ModE-like protein
VFQCAGIEKVVVACSGENPWPEKHCAHRNLIFVRVKNAVQMLDFVKAGLQYLQGKCSAVFIAPMGVPLFSDDTVRRLMQVSAPVCVPRYNGQNGHPLLLQADCFADILAYNGENGLAGAIQAASLLRVFVDVDDVHIATNVHRACNSDWMQHGYSLTAPHARFTFRIEREQIFYGSGAHLLLKLVHETGSLSEACRYSGISYSKGRQIIARLEEQLGQTVIQRYAGGKRGGRSLVTPDGLQLMERYDAFCTQAQAELDALFEVYFPPSYFSPTAPHNVSKEEEMHG